MFERYRRLVHSPWFCSLWLKFVLCPLGWKVKVTQLSLTLCNPMNYTVHGILQARILELVTFPFSRGSSQARDRTQVSRIAGGFFTSWTTREAHWNETCLHITHIYWAFQVALVVKKKKKPACQCRRHKRHRFNSWVGRIPWKRAWQLTPVFLPGESHRQSIGSQGVRNNWSNLACTQLTFTGPRNGETVSVTVLEKWRQLPIPPQAYCCPN